jgi:hypothetical protein
MTIAVDDGNTVAGHNPILPSGNYQFPFSTAEPPSQATSNKTDQCIGQAILLTQKRARSTVRRDQWGGFL